MNKNYKGYKGYNSAAIEHLSRDPVMKGLTDKYGQLEFRAHQEDIFAEIVDSIVSQQLSGKVAAVIYSRFEGLFPEKKIQPEAILKIDDAKLRSVGISWAKVKYIKDLAGKAADGTLQLAKLASLADDEVIEHLTQVKGIGRWTAEMILMFALGRPDVFSLGDLGLRTAVSQLYFVERSDLIKIEEISRQWSPHRSLASRYLWKSLEN